MHFLKTNWSLISIVLALVPIGIYYYLQSIHPTQYLKLNLLEFQKPTFKMSSDEHFKNMISERADQLREYVFSQPSSTFTNNPGAVADAIETFANEKGHMMIFRDTKLEVARAQLKAQQPAPRTILEFGTFVGKSALAWAAILRDIHGENVPDDVNVYTFELDPKMVALSRDLIKLAGVEDLVHVIEGPASESVKRLHAEGTIGSVDMAFFDHWEKFYLPDLQLVEDLGLFRVGSLAIADNTDFPGAPDYLRYVKDGGRVAGAVKYESTSFETPSARGKPSIVEVSKIVAVE